jgi:hypothetical protein
VVDAPANCQYFALSYTWGNSSNLNHLRLTRASERRMRENGALNYGNLEIQTL